MSTREYAGHEVEIDQEGFMVESGQWNRDIASAIAAEVGVGPLGERHWQVIDFCRADSSEQGTPPGLRRISKLSGVGMKELYQLFPKGPGKLAARIAGLPKPQGCV